MQVLENNLLLGCQPYFCFIMPYLCLLVLFHITVSMYGGLTLLIDFCTKNARHLGHIRRNIWYIFVSFFRGMFASTTYFFPPFVSSVHNCGICSSNEPIAGGFGVSRMLTHVPFVGVREPSSYKNRDNTFCIIKFPHGGLCTIVRSVLSLNIKDFGIHLFEMCDECWLS